MKLDGPGPATASSFHEIAAWNRPERHNFDAEPKTVKPSTISRNEFGNIPSREDQPRSETPGEKPNQFHPRTEGHVYVRSLRIGSPRGESGTRGTSGGGFWTIFKAIRAGINNALWKNR